MFDECCEGDKLFNQQLSDAYEKSIINNDELADPQVAERALLSRIYARDPIQTS